MLGFGVVKKLEGEAKDIIAHIQFGTETKKIMLKYAPLSKV